MVLLLLAEDNPATGRNKNLESLVSGHVREINYVCAERNLSTTRSLVVFGTRTMYVSPARLSPSPASLSPSVEEEEDYIGEKSDGRKNLIVFLIKADVTGTAN